MKNNSNVKLIIGLKKWLKCLYDWFKTISWFTKLKTKIRIITVARQIGTKSEVSKLKFYQTLIDLPLLNFLKCLCDNDYSYLYIDFPKKRNPIEEAEHFANLAIEYSELINGESVNIYDNAKKEASLIAKIRVLESAMGLIDNLPESVIKVLKSLGIRLTDDINNNALLIHGKINILTREYNSLKDKENSKEKPTIDNYIKILTAMSTHFKIHLDIHTVTVSSFCHYYRQFMNEIKLLNKSNKKNHGSGKH